MGRLPHVRLGRDAGTSLAACARVVRVVRVCARAHLLARVSHPSGAPAAAQLNCQWLPLASSQASARRSSSVHYVFSSDMVDLCTLCGLRVLCLLALRCCCVVKSWRVEARCSRACVGRPLSHLRAINGLPAVTRRLFHPAPATNGNCDRHALRYIAVMGSMCILLSCGIYSMVKGALLLVGRGVGTAANNTTGNISTFVDTASAPQHVMVRQHINARTSITYLDITCSYLCEQASGTMLVIACASSALCCAAEGCLLLRHVRVRAEEQKLGIARMLELTRPHAKWLLAGCIALVIRLPFSVSLPHFVAETIGTSLSLSLSLAPLRGPDAALAKWTCSHRAVFRRRCRWRRGRGAHRQGLCRPVHPASLVPLQCPAYCFVLI